MTPLKPQYDVVVVGGGNAALCAAMEARRGGAEVVIIEAAPAYLRGGNSRHTRNVRYFHSGTDNFLVGSYEEEEFYKDLLQVTHGETNEELARMMIRASADLGVWIRGNGVRWQGALKGRCSSPHQRLLPRRRQSPRQHVLRNRRRPGSKPCTTPRSSTSSPVPAPCRRSRCAARLARAPHAPGRTNALNADFRLRRTRASWPAATGCRGRTTAAPFVDEPRGAGEATISAKAIVVASGGFEANLGWMSQYWGEAVNNFAIRGTPYNRGKPVQALFDKGAKAIGSTREFHAVAVDARGPQFDGGIVTRLDTVPFGIVVNREGRPLLGRGRRLLAEALRVLGRPDRAAARAGRVLAARCQDVGGFHAVALPARRGGHESRAGDELQLDPETWSDTVTNFNAAVQAGTYDPTTLDDCSTQGSSRRRATGRAPSIRRRSLAYPLRPGITFTYHGLNVNDRAQIIATNDEVMPGLFAAGEAMAGNILGRGYLAGFGMTIGSVFGRIAGREAVKYALA